MSVISPTKIRITNICPTSDCPIDSNISFTISNLYNPPSLKPFQGFILNSLDSNMNMIEESSNIGLTVN